jgi:hypothetical protein
MRTLQRFLGILFVLAIWTGCGDGQQQPDISGVIDRHCAYRLDCDWEDDFEVCRQSGISATAALTYVYGPECGDAWLDLLDCESSRACDVFFGCEAENQRYNELCF